jgi:Ca2+-transporting ATPase
MNKPPRNLRESLFSKRSVLFSLLQGLSILAVVFGVFMLALYLKKGEMEARTLAFATLVFGNILLIITNLSWSKNIVAILKSRNSALGGVIIGALTALGFVLYWTPLRNLFHFSILSGLDITVALTCGIISIAWFEFIKKLNVLTK